MKKYLVINYAMGRALQQVILEAWSEGAAITAGTRHARRNWAPGAVVDRGHKGHIIGIRRLK